MVNKQFLFKYFSHSKILKSDYLQYDISKNMSYFGEHFKSTEIGLKAKLILAKKVGLTCLGFFISLFLKNYSSDKPKVLSSAYFNFDNELGKKGYYVIRPIWSSYNFKRISLNWLFFLSYIKMMYALETKGINELVGDKTANDIKQFQKILKNWVIRNNIKALFVPSDFSFFHRISIDIFKELKIPTFLASHGLPAKYNNFDENRTDYLLVWGNKVKENYIKAGISAKKIFVTGHPLYSNYAIPKNLKFDFKNILIITKGVCGVCPISKENILSDRGNLILYLFSIEKVLKEFGVNQVRLRNHPSENSSWYFKHIDTSFFKQDNQSLDESICSADLIIGPSSTVFLESIIRGINYLIYEPAEKGFDLFNYPLVEPFDGSNKSIPVANSEDQLREILFSKKAVDPNILHDYLQSNFDLSEVYKIIVREY